MTIPNVLGQTPGFNGYGVTNDPQPKAKSGGGLMNAFAKVMEFGAPEAFEAGRQKKYRRNLSNAFKAGDMSAASNALFDMGEYGAGLDLRDSVQVQQTSQQNEKARMAYEMTKGLMNEPDVMRRVQLAQQMSQQLGLPAPTDPSEFTNEAITQNLEVMRIKGGFDQDQGEAYTLAPGARRFGPDGQMIAENPKQTDPVSTFSIMTPEQEVQYFGSDMPGNYQLESGTNKVSPVTGTAPRAPLVQNTINPDAPPMPSKGTLTPLQLKMDERYTDLLVDWNIGGAGDTVKQLSQLREVANQLESGENITGWVIGNMPDWMLAGLNPEAMNAKELVQEVVQRSLRDTLGAQFTEKEGEMLLARAYNPSLEESFNAVRLKRLVEMIESRAQQLNSLNQYMQTNGTSAGWDGSLMSANQILAELDQLSGGANSPQKGQKRRVFNPETGEFDS